MDICSFWFGTKLHVNNLRIVDKLCLASAVLATRSSGKRIKLYSYEEVRNLPDGVENHAADEIMPRDFIYRLNPDFGKDTVRDNISILQFSDFFRVMLMKKQKGLWLDTDLYLYKDFTPSVDTIWLARESFSRLGISVLYFPKECPIVKDFEDYMASDDIMPSWMGFKRKYLKPILLDLKNIEVNPQSVGITLFGNDGISRLAKKHALFNKAHNKQSFYYWTCSKSANIYDKRYGLEPLKSRHFLGFHIHRKQQSSIIPEEGSFYYWAAKRVAEFYGVSFDKIFSIQKSY